MLRIFEDEVEVDSFPLKGLNVTAIHKLMEDSGFEKRELTGEEIGAQFLKGVKYNPPMEF